MIHVVSEDAKPNDIKSEAAVVPVKREVTAVASTPLISSSVTTDLNAKKKKKKKKEEKDF